MNHLSFFYNASLDDVAPTHLTFRYQQEMSQE